MGKTVRGVNIGCFMAILGGLIEVRDKIRSMRNQQNIILDI